MARRRRYQRYRPHNADSEDTGNFFYWRIDGSSCEPFTMYKVECNRCVCHAEGTAYCTKSVCVKKFVNNKLFVLDDKQSRILNMNLERPKILMTPRKPKLSAVTLDSYYNNG